MKRSIYGKRMFVADLLIISIWTLFAWHFCWSNFTMLVLVLMRISISFELYRKSRWASLSALTFAFAYIACIFSMPSTEYVMEPIEKMMYVALCLVGKSDLAIVAFSALGSVIPEWTLWTVWGTISAWLVIMPVFCSLKMENCLRTLLNKRRLWWYLCVVLAITILFMIEVKNHAIIMFCLLMSLLPLAYWILYSGRKRQLIQYVIRDKVLISYIAIMAIFFTAVVIGLYNLSSVKIIAAFILPIILYITVIRLIGLQPATVPAMLFGIGGLFFINCTDRPHELVIAWLITGLVLSLVATVQLIRRSRMGGASCMLFIANGFILPIFLLGYNPYTTISADYVELMKVHDSSAPNSLYLFSEDGLSGVRDRYGVIIPARHDKLYFLDGTNDYVVLANGESDSPNYHLQIFYLKWREYLIPEDGDTVTRIEKIENKKYALFDKSGEQVYALRFEPGQTISPAYDMIYGDQSDAPYLVNCKSISNHDLTVFPDNLADAERKLLEIYEEKEYCDPYLMDLLVANGETIKYPFHKLQEKTGIKITTSADNNIRLYSWDTGMGGTSPEYQTFVQYVAGDTVIVDSFSPIYESKYVCADDIKKDGYDIYDGSYCDGLYQIPMGNGKNAYLAIANNRASSIEGAQECVLIFEKEGRLEKLPFVDKDGEESYSVDALYYIPDWYFTTNGLGWDWVMSFDSANLTLYVPESGDMEMTDRYELYKYHNGKMRYTGKGAGFWLHPSLHDFKRLCGIYQTETKLIRVDRLNDDSYRFASWDKGDAMLGKPELVLHKGKTGVVENAIVFKNGDYTYIVPEYSRGQRNDFGKVIIIYKDKIIQESEV